MFTKKLFAIKYANVGVGLLSGFLQIYLYTRYLSEDLFAFVLTLTGISVFINLLDGGIGKPIYSELRKTYVNDTPNRYLDSILKIYRFIGLGAIVIFTIVALGLSRSLSEDFSLILVLSFSIALAINPVINFYKYIFVAHDRLFFFEVSEFVRRIGFIGCSVLVVIDQSLIATALSQLLLTTVVYWYVSRSAKRLKSRVRSLPVAKVSVLKTLTFFYTSSRDNLIFMVSETLTYSSGFLIFPVFLTASELVLFGIWARLYGALALFHRSLIEISVLPITRAYFQSENKKFLSLYLRITVYAFLVAGAVMLVFFLSSERLLHLWLGENNPLSSEYVLLLVIFVLANSIQHPAGTFLALLGKFFPILRNVSVVLSLSTILIYVSLGLAGFNLNEVLACWLCLYIAGALYYQRVIIKAALR